MGAILLRTTIPGPNSRRLMKMRRRHVPRGPFHTSPIFVEQAAGALLTDVDGNRFIDFTGGLGALNVGHANPAVAAAVREQLGRHAHTCFHIAPYRGYVDLARKLNEITPGARPKKTLFLNSGAEAVENAVKIARYATQRPAIVCFEHGFHGRTLLAMTLTSKVRPYKFGFGPFAPEVYRLPYPCLYRRPRGLSEKGYLDECIAQFHDFFKSQVDPHQVAAVVMELVTGEGGFIVAPWQYVRALAAFCREHGILFIDDEVQTGFGRTGRMFAAEHYDLVPDLLCTAKSLGGGLPLAAVTGRADLMDSVHVGGLGGTFGGNPLACAAGLAAIRYIEAHDLVQRGAVLGRRIAARFERMTSPFIGDRRGLGAMRALEFVKDRRRREPAKAVAERVAIGALERGLLVLTAGNHGNVIRLLMPLVISDAELEEGLDVLEAAVQAAG